LKATCATVPRAIDTSALATFGLDKAKRITAHRLVRAAGALRPCVTRTA
jgi:hypothetical protein